MYRVSDFKKSVYKTGEVAEILGVTTKTIQNYDKDGKLIVKRTEGNRRCIFKEDLLKFLSDKGLLYNDEKDTRYDVIYARVSSNDQKIHGDLDRQVLFLIDNVKSLHSPIILKEVGSGLNDKRVQLQKLLRMVCNNEVGTIYITYKDRLTRFGFNYLKTIFELHGTSIEVIKDGQENKTVQTELVEDMMSLIASFSGKLYGLRSGKNKRKKV